jgi:hypothetical protein
MLRWTGFEIRFRIFDNHVYVTSFPWRRIGRACIILIQMFLINSSLFRLNPQKDHDKLLKYSFLELNPIAHLRYVQLQMNYL